MSSSSDSPIPRRGRSSDRITTFASGAAFLRSFSLQRSRARPLIRMTFALATFFASSGAGWWSSTAAPAGASDSTFASGPPTCFARSAMIVVVATTVFRALEAQVQDGMARRLERSGHVSVYVACDPEHHHHLVCERCERVEDLDEKLLQPLLRSVDSRYGFHVNHTALDIYGLCASCRRASRKAAG